MGRMFLGGNKVGRTGCMWTEGNLAKRQQQNKGWGSWPSSKTNSDNYEVSGYKGAAVPVTYGRAKDVWRLSS
jgi:hypothetical protein